MYQVHSVTIRKEDEAAADLILHEYRWDYDDIRTTVDQHSDGSTTVTYWIKPYIYEDFEAIVNEFKDVGIQVL